MSSAFLRDVQVFTGEVDAAFAKLARLPAFLARRRFDRLKRKLIAPPYLEAAAVDAGRQPSLVSIVLPTFNRRRSLAEAAESLRQMIRKSPAWIGRCADSVAKTTLPPEWLPLKS